MREREQRAAPGLRELKKRATRERIAHVATLMFIERGFDEVTIAEIAAAVPVARMTVTNYFPLKEDLVFDAAGELVGELAEAVRGRPAGVSPLAAVRSAYLAALEARLPLSGHCTPGFARLVHGSPRLRARERVFHEDAERALAAVLAAETGDEATAEVVAAQLAAVQRVLHARVRDALRAGEDPEVITSRAAREAEAAFALLEPALGGFLLR